MTVLFWPITRQIFIPWPYFLSFFNRFKTLNRYSFLVNILLFENTQFLLKRAETVKVKYFRDFTARSPKFFYLDVYFWLCSWIQYQVLILDSDIHHWIRDFSRYSRIDLNISVQYHRDHKDKPWFSIIKMFTVICQTKWRLSLALQDNLLLETQRSIIFSRSTHWPFLLQTWKLRLKT